ncbi:MAG: DNA polymerase III subunit delta' [Hyphomicrobiaceae bacterium]
MHAFFGGELLMARAPSVQDVEVYPECDALAGFGHPRHTSVLYGHQSVELELASAIAEGSIHHGWILAGAEGIGKATLAYHFAVHALSDPERRPPPGEPLIAVQDNGTLRQVRHLSHPNLLVLRRAYDIKAKRFPTAISVDEVRRLKGFLGHKVEEGAWRVVIVDRADELNLNAANALLKSLEEPPPRTIFLLIASEPGRLLPTIRSRCRVTVLGGLVDADLRQAAEQAIHGADATSIGSLDWNRLNRVSGGSVRRLLTLATQDGTALSAAVEQFFMALPNVDWADAHALSARLAPAAALDNFEMFFSLLEERMARLIRHRAGGGNGEGEIANRLIAEDGLATWIDLWETLHREKMDTNTFNLDRSAFILNAYVRIQNAAADKARNR